VTSKHPPGPPLDLASCDGIDDGSTVNQNTPARPPNVGDIRWLGTKSVTLLCRTCPRQQVANIELLPDDVPLAHVASKFVCPEGHQEGAYVLPSLGPSATTDPPT